ALRDRVAGLAESLAGRDAALRTGRTEVERDAAEVQDALDGAESVADRAGSFTERVRFLETWVDALSSLEAAEERRTTRAEELEDALTRNGFPDAAAV